MYLLSTDASLQDPQAGLSCAYHTLLGDKAPRHIAEFVMEQERELEFKLTPARHQKGHLRWVWVFCLAEQTDFTQRDWVLYRIEGELGTAKLYRIRCQNEGQAVEYITPKNLISLQKKNLININETLLENWGNQDNVQIDALSYIVELAIPPGLRQTGNNPLKIVQRPKITDAHAYIKKMDKNTWPSHTRHAST